MTKFQTDYISPQPEVELKDLASRDLRLWSVGLLVAIVLAIGVSALVLPNLMWKSEPMQVQGDLLPQLFTGFIVLIILFNAYLIDQKRQLNTVRDAVVKRLLHDKACSQSPADPLTNVLSRDTVAATLAREKSRADRLRSPLVLAVLDIADFRALNHKYGSLVGDHALLVVAQLMKSTFRGSDSVVRLGGDEFLVLMPDTDQYQARCAIGRLTAGLQTWNLTTEFQYKLALHVGIGCYNPGADIDEVIAEATERACATEASVALGMARKWSHLAALPETAMDCGKPY